MSLSILLNEFVYPGKTNLNHMSRIDFYDSIWKLESPHSLHEKDQPVHFFKTTTFVLHRRNKVMQVWNDMWVSK